MELDDEEREDLLTRLAAIAGDFDPQVASLIARTLKELDECDQDVTQ